VTAKHGLTGKTLDQITCVLARFSQVEKALLFGSRAKGLHKPGSDIDLALVGDKLDWETIGQIESAFDDLPLPYCFSLILLSERTDSEVAAHIHRVGIPLFERSAAAIR
jgi:predicted nucleotidyltransferase